MWATTVVVRTDEARLFGRLVFELAQLERDLLLALMREARRREKRLLWELVEHAVGFSDRFHRELGHRYGLSVARLCVEHPSASLLSAFRGSLAKAVALRSAAAKRGSTELCAMLDDLIRCRSAALVRVQALLEPLPS